MQNRLRWISLLSAIPLLFFSAWYFINPSEYKVYIVLPLLLIAGFSALSLGILSAKSKNAP